MTRLLREATVACMGRVSPPDEAIEQRVSAESVAEVLAVLSPREAAVLSFRFGLDGMEPCTLSQIGELVRSTRDPTKPLGPEPVRQIEASALRHLRHPAHRKQVAGLRRS